MNIYIYIEYSCKYHSINSFASNITIYYNIIYYDNYIYTCMTVWTYSITVELVLKDVELLYNFGEIWRQAFKFSVIV